LGPCTGIDYNVNATQPDEDLVWHIGAVHIFSCALLVPFHLAVLLPLIHGGYKTEHNQGGSVRVQIYFCLVQSAYFSKPKIVFYAWRHVIVSHSFQVTFSGSSPSSSLPPIILPPSLFPPSSSPLNFITFRQKGIYCPTKVIAPLMEWPVTP